MRTVAPETEGASRRSASMRIGTLILGLLPPEARRRGLAAAALLADWPTIVGPELASRCKPAGLRFSPGGRGGGVLELWTSGAHALELQHTTPLLLERINGYLGFRAVSRILVRQRPLDATGTEEADPAPPAHPEHETAIAAATSCIPHEELRTALAGLGRRLLARERRRERR